MRERKKISSLVKEDFVFYETITGSVCAANNVEVNESKVGKVLFSDYFEPCNAVLALLKNGEYGLYHAQSMAKTQALMSFVELIKDKVEYVFVFQKSNKQVNLRKAPYLAVGLARELNCNVKRVHVDSYTGIYVNTDDKKVILFNKEDNLDKTAKITSITGLGAGKKIDLDTSTIGLNKTVIQLFQTHQEDYKSTDENIIVSNDIEIPKNLFERLKSSHNNMPKHLELLRPKK